MEGGVGLLILLVLGANLACDARQLSASDMTENSRNENLCTLCEELSAEALEYLAENETQTEIIKTLHQTCSGVPSFKQQCITLVDYYAPLFFLEVTSLQPADFCRKVNLCELSPIVSKKGHEDSCGVCQRTISEVLIKLKDPDTQLEILELLLKGCNSMEKKYVKKCKRMVFEYAPIILTNAEQFLETTDICTMLHACTSSTASRVEASDAVYGSVLANA